MFRLAVKNLWARRHNNVWLFAELVMVVIIGWIVIDPVVVRLYDATRPYGYDRDRLVEMEFAVYGPEVFGYRPENADSLVMERDYYALYGKVKEIPEVESATVAITYYTPEKPGTNIRNVIEPDTTKAIEISYAPGTSYFSTLGIRSVPGSPSVKELDDMPLASGDIIVTREFAGRLFPGENAVGKKICDGTMTIRGVVEDVRLKGYMNTRLYIFYSDEYVKPPYIYGWDRFSVVARLKDGVDAGAFASDKGIVRELKAGNFYCRSVSTVAGNGRKLEKMQGLANSVTVGTSLLVFFLLSLALGVTGIFWLQTRRRSREAGILKSFGARPACIVRSMLWEGCIITVLAWATGCMLYLQYAMNNGLADKERLAFSTEVLPRDWATDFTIHFIVISSIVLVLVLAVVLAGIYIPARRISHVNPVDALRDE